MEDLASIFWQHVDRTGGEAACWPWKGTLTDDGYGTWRVPRRFLSSVSRSYWRAHRLAWVIGGNAEPALPLDHLCHDPAVCALGNACPHRRCCNPLHMRPATPAENHARSTQAVRTHCPAGHPYEGANLMLKNNGRNRQCRACANAASARRWSLNRERYNANRRSKAAR